MAESRKSDCCSDCNSDSNQNLGRDVDRRAFLQTTGSAIMASAALPATLLSATATGDQDDKPAAETLVKKLYDSMSGNQRASVCFDWDHVQTYRSGMNKSGLLRTRVENNCQVTGKKIDSKLFSNDQ